MTEVAFAVRTKLGHTVHLASATVNRTACGLEFSRGFDDVRPADSDEAAHAAFAYRLELCQSCKARIVAWEQRRAGADSVERADTALG